MQKNRSKNIKDTKLYLNKQIGYYIPIIFMIVIVPLITFGKIIELNPEESNFWLGGKTHVDFYNYYKSIAIILATLSLSVAYGALFLNNKLPLQKEKRYYLPMNIYILMATISTIMAHNKHIAVVGFIEMHQGIFVLISYIVITFIIMNYIRQDNDIKIIVYSFMLITLLEGILGISQYFGFDFLKSALGLKLITPKELSNSIINFNFGKYTIYGTLYNTNFVGSFATLTLPLTIILYLYETEKVKSITFGIVSLLAFSLWLGCNSRAGYLGIILATILGTIVFRKVIKLKYKKSIILIIGFIFISLIFNIVSGGRSLNQFLRLNPYAQSDIVENNQYQNQIKFEEVSINKNEFIIKTNKNVLSGVIDDSTLSFFDEFRNKLDLTIDSEGKMKFIDKRYDGYDFRILSQNPAQIKASIYGRNWDLFITTENEFKVISFNNKLMVPLEAPRLKLFDGKETFASNRGYIWSRTIPMLKDTVIIGYGPDNFPMVFPQEDYVGRFNVGSSGMIDILIDKPHNMYLQSAVNTGILSLVSLISIWSIYLIDSLKIYIKGNIKSFAEYMGAVIFLSISAYLIAGIFNDSVVSVAPLFWVLLGTGIGINRMILDKKGI